MNHTDPCQQCQKPLKDQFIENLKNQRLWKDFVGAAILARFPNADRHIDLVARVKPASHMLYFEIQDDHKTKMMIHDFSKALEAYTGYIEDNG